MPDIHLNNAKSRFSKSRLDTLEEKLSDRETGWAGKKSQKLADNNGLKFLEGNSEVAEITDELLDALLDKIVVYADKTIELRWKISNRSN